MSGTTRSIPNISSSGNIRPQSITTMSSPYSKTYMFLPISPTPPSGMIRRTGWGLGIRGGGLASCEWCGSEHRQVGGRGLRRRVAAGDDRLERLARGLGWIGEGRPLVGVAGKAVGACRLVRGGASGAGVDQGLRSPADVRKALLL